MKKVIHLSQKEKLAILVAYRDCLETVASLAKKYGMTRAGIYHVLHVAGVDTRKSGPNVMIHLSCAVCGKEIVRPRSIVRRQKILTCSPECLSAWQGQWQSHTSSSATNSMVVARAVVAQYFPLKPDHVVHRINGNEFDNSKQNLQVFANHGDHIRCHRGCEVPVLWDGSTG